MVLPLGLAYTLASRVKPVLRVFLGYASLTIMAGIVVTLSRGSWLSTALSLVVFFGVLLFQRGHRLASLALLVVILGGAGSIWGAVAGAGILTLIPEILRPIAQYRMLLYGLLMLLVMIFRPKGVLGK